MKTLQAKRHGARLKMLWIASLLGAAALLASCGGGGGGSTAGVGSGGTGAAFSGPITGFGSVIVNGVRLDDSSATVTLDDDSVGASGNLRLGMVVEIEGSRNADGVTGKANTIGSHSVVRGPVTATPTATTFKILGLTVTVTAGTVFEGVDGILGLGAGDMVEIHGIPNGPDGVTATRIETTGNDEERLTGVIQALDQAAKTFTLHGTLINYAATPADKVPTNIANGLTVRVKGQLTTSFATEPGTIDATRVQIRNKLKKNGQLLELEGVVTKFTSATDFEVNGVTVSVAGNARVEGTVSANSRIEVEGTVDANGVLIATKVEVKNENVQNPEANELHGLISAFNATNNSFTLRGVTVTFVPGTVVFERLTLSSLKDGIKVEVKGKVTVTAAGTAVLATRIKLED